MIEYRCPNCGSENLRVVVEIPVKLVQQEESTDLAQAGEPGKEDLRYWDDESAMFCDNPDCFYDGSAKDFEVLP